MSIERETWYWISHSQEGDIFIPLFVNSAGQYYMGGRALGLVESVQVEEGLTWHKAEMPDSLMKTTDECECENLGSQCHSCEGDDD